MKDEPKLGKTIKDDDETRDAVHVAVLSCCSNYYLRPGDPIDLELTDEGYYAVPSKGKGVGIVDPFLANNINAGVGFYVLLYPGTITSLKHYWTHPDIPTSVKWEEPEQEATEPEPEISIEQSEQWMEEFAKEHLGTNKQDAIELGDRFYDGEHVIVNKDNGRGFPDGFGGQAASREDYGGETMRDWWYEESNQKTFWTHYCNITGKEMPDLEDYGVGGFTCSC